MCAHMKDVSANACTREQHCATENGTNMSKENIHFICVYALCSALPTPTTQLVLIYLSLRMGLLILHPSCSVWSSLG